MDININVTGLDNLAAAINNLASALLVANKKQNFDFNVQSGEDIPFPPTKKSAAAMDFEEANKEEPKKEEISGVTLAELREICAPLAKGKTGRLLANKLKELGAKNLTTLDKSSYKEMLDFAKSISNGEPKKEEPKKEEPKKEEPKKEEPKKEEPKKEEPKKEESKKEESKKEEPSSVTLKDLREICKPLAKGGKGKLLADKLKELGAKNLTTLDESKYMEMFEFVKGVA